MNIYAAIIGTWLLILGASSTVMAQTGYEAYPELIKGTWQELEMHVGIPGDTMVIKAPFEHFMVFGEEGYYKTGGVIDGKESWNESFYSVSADKLVIDGEIQLKRLDENMLVTRTDTEDAWVEVYYKRVEDR